MIAIHKIKLISQNEVFLISDFRPENKLSVTVLDINNNEAFCGSATDEELRSIAAKIRMKFSTFINVTKNALSQDTYGDLKFLYSLEKNCQVNTFKWISVDSDETKVIIGILNMHQSEYQQMVKDTFLLLSKELLSLNKKILNTEEILKKSTKDKEETLQLLTEAVHVKECIEMELYSKFALILNEKKRKIRELSCNSVGVPPKRTKFSNKPSRVLHQLSDSESDATDNDNMNNQNPVEGDKVNVNEAGPSNVNQNNSLLFLDDDDIKVSISPSKIRNRKAADVPVNNKYSAGKAQEMFSQIYDSDSPDLLDLI